MAIVELVLKKLDSSEMGLAGNGMEDYFSLFFHVFDIGPSKKWLNHLKKAVLKDKGFTQHYLKSEKVNGRFVGFSSHQKSKFDLANMLNEAIKIINNYRENTIPLKATEYATQKELNELHHYFEVLGGPILNPSEFLLTAPREVKSALDDLNLLVHEFESILESDVVGDNSLAQLDVTFSGYYARDRFSPDDFRYFDPVREFGGLYLHYTEVGKQVLDAYFNNDDIIASNNIRPLEYVSANFDIFFGKSTKSCFELEFKKKFGDWLRKQSLDPKDERLSIGYIKLGQLIKDSRIANLSREEFFKKIAGYLNVHSVMIHEAIY